jgi:hypothetical protein
VGVAHAARIVFYVALGIGAIAFLLWVMELPGFKKVVSGCLTGFGLLNGAVGIIAGFLLLYSAVVDADGARFVGALVAFWVGGAIFGLAWAAGVKHDL